MTFTAPTKRATQGRALKISQTRSSHRTTALLRARVEPWLCSSSSKESASPAGSQLLHLGYFKRAEKKSSGSSSTAVFLSHDQFQPLLVPSTAASKPCHGGSRSCDGPKPRLPLSTLAEGKCWLRPHFGKMLPADTETKPCSLSRRHPEPLGTAPWWIQRFNSHLVEIKRGNIKDGWGLKGSTGK